MDVSKLSELLECSVCLNTLDISSKVLPCQHTFCKKCLQEIVDSRKELRCPECRVLVTVPVDDLPPNVLLTRILEGMKNAANQVPPPVIATLNAHASSAHASSLDTNNTGEISQVTIQAASLSVSERISNPDGPSSIVSETNSSSPQHQGQQQHQTKPKVPYAKAIFDFNSKESGDLNFKKNDLILLKKRIDQNWYIGEINGKTGSFPINHVHVIMPLPVAQCKALYDFRMKPNEEEGCLAFKKGTLINVLRRVDHNWAEGRIEDAIGIFPISFVEMNSMAKQLMEISAKNLQLSSSVRSVPMPPFETSFNNSDSSSTTTTSPNSTPSNTSSSNSSTAPNSPINQSNEITTAAIQTRTGPPSNVAINSREKRNSLTTLLNATNGQVSVSNRHSAEILSVPELERVGASNVKPIAVQRPERGHNRSKSGHHNPHHAHIQAYVAMHPYSPQKPDELELKKGSVYYVLEKCQDGWFKGINRQQKSGVFPGNYVAPIRTRDTQLGNPSNHNQKQPIFISQANYQKTLQNPPDLPPRNNEHASAASTTTTNNSLSAWSKTLHNSCMDSLFNRKPSQQQQQPPQLNINSDKASETSQQSGGSASHNATSTESQKTSVKEKKDSSAISFVKRLTKRSKSPSASSSAITASYSMDNPVFEDSSVPSASASSRPNINLSHPVHVRSGSCPSQLLQNIPIDGNNQANRDAPGPFVYGSQRIKGHKERPSMAHLRNNADLTISAANNRLRNAQVAAAAANQQQQAMMSLSSTQQQLTSATNAPIMHQHRKSQSLDATTLSAQLTSDSSSNATAVAKLKNTGYTRERFRCVVPYPPNSEYELELRVGDIVFVSKKRENGWYKGQHQRTGKIGLFPASFVQPDM